MWIMLKGRRIGRELRKDKHGVKIALFILGTTFILAIPMAVLADTYIGRFKTLVISASGGFLQGQGVAVATPCSGTRNRKKITGLVLLGLQAHCPKLKPPRCNIFDSSAHCISVKGKDAALLFLSLYMVAVGSAGVKAGLPAHGADQFDEKDPKEARAKSGFFNCLLLALCIGAVGTLTFLVWVQDNKGWDRGFLIVCIVMFLGIIVLVVGLPWYRINVMLGKNPIIEIIQVYVVAIRNRKLVLPKDPEELYEIEMDIEAAIDMEYLPRTTAFRFLDKAAIKKTTISSQESTTPWKACSVTQVENAKILLELIPIFCCSIMVTLCPATLQTMFVQQGVTMDTRMEKSFHIPPASLPIFPIVFLIILIPLYDRVGVPVIRKFTCIPTGITHLQRIGIGLVLSALSMAVAGLMEVRRKKVARTHNMLDTIPVLQPLPINVIWLVFQYSIFGIADMFTYVGVLEFFYSQAPRGLKFIATSFYWSSMALGYYLSTILVKIVNSATKDTTTSRGWLAGNNTNRNHLNIFFWLLAILSLTNVFVFIFVSKRYNYRSHNPKSMSNNSKEMIAGDDKIHSFPLTSSDNLQP